MPARYFEGTKVKIKIGHSARRCWPVDLRKYENLTGRVLESKTVIGYISKQFTTGDNITTMLTTIYMYSIELEDGAILYDVTEYDLEEL